MAKRKRLELELEIQKCLYMILNLEKLKKPFKLYLECDGDKVDIGEICLESEKDVICGLTKKPCVLNNPGDEVNPLRHIDYHYLDRCPSSAESVIKYKLKGKKGRDFLKNLYFRVSNVERIEG